MEITELDMTFFISPPLFIFKNCYFLTSSFNDGEPLYNFLISSYFLCRAILVNL